MTDPATNFRETLSLYAPQLLEAVADRVAQGTRGRKGNAVDRIEKALGSQKIVEKQIAELEPAERDALAVLLRSPGVFWRWDHAVRLLTACGVSSAYRALQTLLAEGLVCMRSESLDGRVMRFELPSDLVSQRAPSVGLSQPLTMYSLDLPLPIRTPTGVQGTRWRHVDGWDIPIRVGLLWQLAHRLPIRKTQQNQLFKRDQERILLNPLLASGVLDAAEPIEDLGNLVYQLAVEQGLLRTEGEEQIAVAALHEFWPESLVDVLQVCGRALWTVEDWNELGPKTPVGVFSRETATARFLLLLLLSQLNETDGATCEMLSTQISSMHPPWNASGDLIGALRKESARSVLALQWTKAALLGPIYQLGLVEVGSGTKDSTLVRLSPLGRRILGLPGELPPHPTYPQTLIVQPNHSVIVYRQGLSAELLSRLLQFSDAKSVGAALTFELTAESVYRGLEAGLSADDMAGLLVRFSGRDLPTVVASSIQTWSQKRERLTVFMQASLLEFASAKDADRAVEAGLEGVRINDRIIILSGEQERNLSVLRFTSSRDYRLPPEPCVAAMDDGVTLAIDGDKSDLLLDAELQRFALPAPSSNGSGRDKLVRVTPQSIRAALERGMTDEMLDDWFQRRTGDSPPASVKLLLQAAKGLNLRSARHWIVRTVQSEIADGLMQHPRTRELFLERLGPTSLAVADENLAALRDAVAELGVAWDIEPSA